MNLRKTQNPNGTLVKYGQLAEETNCGIGTVMRLARESGSLIKIGKNALVDREKYMEYIRTAYSVEE